MTLARNSDLVESLPTTQSAPTPGAGARTRGPRRVVSRGVRLALIAAVLGALHAFLVSDLASSMSLGPVWALTYALSLVPILRQVRLGRLIHPAVLFPAAYLFLLGLGSLLFALVRDDSYPALPTNLVGAGYVALWCGLLVLRPQELNGAALRLELGAIASRHGRMLQIYGAFLSVGACLALFASAGGLPLLAADPSAAKAQLTSGRGHLAIFLIGLGLVTTSFLYDGLARNSRRALRYSHLWMAVTALVFLAIGSRSRLVFFLLTYWGLYVLVQGKRIRLAVVAALGVAALLGVVLVGAHRRGTTSLPDLFREFGITVVSRPTMLSLIVGRYDDSDLRYGSLLVGDLGKLLPGEQTGANVDLKYAIFDKWENMPESAGVSPSIVGEAYMNFGRAGAAWTLFAAGLITSACYRRFLVRPGFARCAVYLTLLVTLAGAVSSGIGARLVKFIQYGVFIVPLAFLYLQRDARPQWRLTGRHE